MSSPTSTAFDFSEGESTGTPLLRSPSITSDTTPIIVPMTRSRHCIPDTVAFFKVEDHLFHIDRSILDQETSMIPPGQGSKENPIELINIKSADFDILLDFLIHGTRYNKTPLTVADWASIISVCSRYGMQRVLDLACKALLDRHKDTANVCSAGNGFERDIHGLYFLIREKGTDHYLGTYACRNVEGVQLQLWPRDKEGDGVKRSQIFFLDGSGALHHAASGLAVDIVDDVPVLRRRRPVSGRPNPWSHPLPEFSFVKSQIRVKFHCDPSLPSCTDNLYPRDSWAKKNFVLAVRTEKNFHMHSLADFSPWTPPAVAGYLPYDSGANHDKKWRVLVEERKKDAGGDRTSWEIVPASKI